MERPALTQSITLKSRSESECRERKEFSKHVFIEVYAHCKLTILLPISLTFYYVEKATNMMNRMQTVKASHTY